MTTPRRALNADGVPRRLTLGIVCIAYCLLALPFATVCLDRDEFSFVREPYELIGGDYTVRYLENGETSQAFDVAARAYGLYWRYRPLFSPLVREEHLGLFAAEEARFGYVKRESVEPNAPDRIARYRARLVVPEPDRFYSHGSGKPLLAAVLSIPQLALVQLSTRNGESLIEIQNRHNYHPVFALVRAVQLLAGLLTIVLVHRLALREFGREAAVWASALTAFFPLSLKYFPNLHHDAILIPFLVFTVDATLRRAWAQAGVAFGLALASKNAAIFLAPVLLLHVAFELHALRATLAPAALRAEVAQRARGVGLAAVLALAVLLPFANPVAYAEEILTPLTGRAFDPRGEDVTRFFATTKLASAGDAGLSQPRPAVRAVQQLLYFDQVAFFPFVLVLFGMFRHCTRALSRVSLAIVLFSVPFGFAFDHRLSYRSLFFVPFFALACVDLLTPRAARALTGLLLAISFVYAIDPITTGTATYPPEARTFLGALVGSLRF